MKLYTEETVKFIAKAIYEHDFDSNKTPEELVDELKPIELPSDEEIEDKGKWVFNDAGHTIYTHYNTVPSWVAGAKWMREQITKTK